MDYLPNGRQTERGFHRGPLAIAIGETELKLLEVVPKPGPAFTVGERIALLPQGGVPPPIDHVRRRLTYDEQTATAKAELPAVLERIVIADPARYLKFFNDAPAVSRRFHLLELLPGIGKKTMLAIVEERKRGPFSSFGDLELRVHLKDSAKLIVGRIEQELEGVDDKYRLFVAP